MSKFIDKILDSMKLNDDDFDDDDDMLFEDEDEEEEEPAPRRSRFRKETSFQDDDEEVVTSLRPAARQRSSNNLVPMRSGARGAMEVCMVKPTSVEDSREICDTLLSGRTVVINLEGIHIEIAQRIIDFTSGACYSMGGNLQKISNYIFIVTPKNVELSGDFQDMMIVNDDMGISTLGLNL